ncbi:prohibitin, partial [Blastocystis sp. ATCC 50177/Nand II]
MAEAARMLTKVAKWSIGIGAGLYVFNACIYDVDGGERAVIFDRFRGVLPKTVGEGTHFKIPFIMYPYKYDIRTTPREISTETGTK